MLHQDKRFSEAVEAAVAAIEAKTDAEIVVVAAPQSGSYADLAWGAGAIGGLLTLAGVLFAPVVVSPTMVLVDVVISALVIGWVCTGPRAIRALTRRARREAQVRQAASLYFHLDAVHATPNRLGVLVYVSALEGLVIIEPDLGIEAKIPAGRWAPVHAQLRHDDLGHFLAGLEAAGAVLAEHLPASGGARGHLSDAPRIRS